MPVPTASERLGVDPVTYADGSTDTLNVPVESGHCCNSGALSAAELISLAPSERTPMLQRQRSPRTQISSRSGWITRSQQRTSFFARFNFDNLTGPTTNPDQTAIDPSFGVQYIDRQRNVVGTWTRTATPRLTFESSISITRSTPGFPTPNQTDPAVKFNDGLFEAFNSAGGSVMQAYGNLFQGRENVAYATAQHAFKVGAEFRGNRDTTYFGTSPNGEYDFGGGTAYATEAIPSESGTHDIQPGDPLPDTLSGFLSGSPFAYTVALAPKFISGGEHIGPAAINRNNVNAYFQDTWKLTPKLTLDYGIRWELYTPITERARRTAVPTSTACSSTWSIRSRATARSGKAGGRACRRRGNCRATSPSTRAAG